MEYGLLLFAYLFGAIPFGLVVARVAKKTDIRTEGSGNIGATNMTRVHGRTLGAITFALDALKGVVPVLLAKVYFDFDIAALSGVAAVLGHIFPVYLRFKGGKGVATTLAVLAALYWPLGLLAALVWILVFFATRISSLAALATMILAPTFALFFSDHGRESLLYVTLFLSILVTLRHHQNIRRLIAGEEGKV